MTYINGVVPTPATILFTKTDHGSGALSLNDIIDLNTTAIFNNTSITLNADNLVLGAGNYMIEAGLGIDNSADPINNWAEFNLTVDGVAQNSPGTSIQNNKVGVDASVCALSIESGTKTIKIKITAIGGTCSVADNYSYIKVIAV